MQLDKIVRRTAVGLALALAWSTPFGAQAASETGQYAVKGIGIQKCADFTQAYEKRTQGAFVFAGWVDGYISAYNRAHTGIFDAAPWQSVDVLLALIHNHCSKAPEERLYGVVHAMLEYFKEQQLTESSPAVEAAVGDKKVTVYKEVLRRAQDKLVAAGVNPLDAKLRAKPACSGRRRKPHSRRTRKRISCQRPVCRISRRWSACSASNHPNRSRTGHRKAGRALAAVAAHSAISFTLWPGVSVSPGCRPLRTRNRSTA